MAQDIHLTSENLYEHVKEALNLWDNAHSDVSPLGHLQIFRDERSKKLSTIRQATNNILFYALQTLRKSSESEADLIEKRFLDKMEAHKVASSLNIAIQTVYNNQRKAIQALADILYTMEVEAYTENRTMLQERLELPSCQQLVGVQASLDTLIALLENPQPPWIIAIEGMGGIGKTALVDALMRRMIDENLINGLAWVTARQQQFQLDGSLQSIERAAMTPEALIEELAQQLLDDVQPGHSRPTLELLPMLHKRLQEVPHIIVIDNLETVADISSLLETLHRLMNPTKFVLTSRVLYLADPEIYHFSVPDLSQPDALTLVRQEAQRRNLSHLQVATDDELIPIVETVGGNPLALRLVVGQMHLYPLAAILDNLTNARGSTVENLYTFIYEQIWSQLDETTRLVLIAMPLVTSLGATAAELAEVSKIDELTVLEALANLVRFNLVDMRGDMNHRQYTIHNLTRAFLHEQVIQWQ